MLCRTSWCKVIYMSVTVKLLERNKMSRSQSKLKENGEDNYYTVKPV